MVLNRLSHTAASILIGAALCCPAPAHAQEAVPAAAACSVPAVEAASVVARFPHDPRAFTQGLLWHDGALFESVGQTGRSEVRRVDPDTGRVLARRAIPARQFGEGLALIGDELVQLTWTSGIAHRYAARDLQPRGSFRYGGEGWGLTTLGDRLVRSDGSDILTFHARADFAETGRIAVRLGERRLKNLNELEAIDGAIYANVWMQPAIVSIDPATGCVTRRIDLAPLVAEVGLSDSDSVLNGIAWDPERRRLFVTGKYWPTLFEIALP
ncbi:glutaminyl-peptide cyclotransferase [Sphingomonas qomolangmaensis]|uniref:Glutaminyl-peptide cyclotransferase n=1 Tax=Sphingomonas qomolangmaensis TaxID=2918765 RepID=A0ABY5L7K4_9SPHN|nr:glutaminyl-peptide cyclotransferase [Sphingomonas qomolangmaensis]UUL82959.1 glutaminyl-peptide cyclotransferase [Sphingomonas qomolangmaensis]